VHVTRKLNICVYNRWDFLKISSSLRYKKMDLAFVVKDQACLQILTGPTINLFQNEEYNS